MQAPKSLLQNTYVFLDLETNAKGGHPDPLDDEIIDIAALKIHPDGREEVFQTFVQASRPLTPFIKYLTGITQEQVDGGAKDPQKALQHLYEFIGSAPIVGHNMKRFDLQVLEKYLPLPEANRIFDTLQLAAFINPAQTGGHSVENLMRTWKGCHYKETHQALPDCRDENQLMLYLVQTLFHQLWGKEKKWMKKALERARVCGWEWAETLQTELLRAPQRASRAAKAIPKTEPEKMQKTVKPLVTDKNLLEAVTSKKHLLVETEEDLSGILEMLPTALEIAGNSGKKVVISLHHKYSLALLEEGLKTLQNEFPHLRYTRVYQRSDYFCQKRLKEYLQHSDISEQNALYNSELSSLILENWTKLGAEICADLPYHFVKHSTLPQDLAERIACVSCLEESHKNCPIYKKQQELEETSLLLITHKAALNELPCTRQSDKKSCLSHLDSASLLNINSIFIFGEIHHLEDDAVEAFSMSTSQQRLKKLLSDIQAEEFTWEPLRNAFRKLHHHPFLQQRMRQALGKKDEGYSPSIVVDYKDSGFSPLKEVFRELKEALETLVTSKPEHQKTRSSILQLLELWENPKKNNFLLELSAIRKGSPEENKKSDLYHTIIDYGIRFIPQNIPELLNQKVWSRISKGILFSSLMPKNTENWPPLSELIGLAAQEYRPLKTGKKSSKKPLAPRVILLSDLPEVKHKDFTRTALELSLRAVIANDGRALILVTSNQDLLTIYRYLEPHCTQNDILVLPQASAAGLETSGNRKIIEALKSRKRTVVIGSHPFRETLRVDAETLNLLILWKLPFAIPSSYIKYQEAIRANGFDEYYLPKSNIPFQQSLQRLMAHDTTQSNIIILDNRLQKPAYHMLRHSIPSHMEVLTIPSTQMEMFLRSKTVVQPGKYP